MVQLAENNCRTVGGKAIYSPPSSIIKSDKEEPYAALSELISLKSTHSFTQAGCRPRSTGILFV